MVVAAVALILLLLWTLARQGSLRARGDLLKAPRVVAVTGELEQEVQLLLAGGHKIDAIRRVRESSGLGLAQAKELVERLEQKR
jgi:ribosomal protein L7/L12